MLAGLQVGRVARQAVSRAGPDVADPSAQVEDALARSLSSLRSPRMFTAGDTDPLAGAVRWQPAKSLWICAMTAVALLAGPPLFTWGAFALFIATTGLTVCLGHSLGMHRRLIHRSYGCSPWLERLFVYVGTLAGMAGPFGMIRQHDIRDWAQRLPDCHAFLAHRSGFWRDGFWQLHCELALERPPRLVLERRVADDRYYQFLERTWRLQQLPWAILFYCVGGWPWLVWGIAARVAVIVTGHWLIGYFAHNQGRRTWRVAGAGVQGYNVWGFGLLTMGEAWHNNHHAFPGSAKLGAEPGEWDPGWWVLCALRRAGLVWDVMTPERLPFRPALQRIAPGENA